MSTPDLRLPPHSIEAEQSVIGGLLLDNRAWDRMGDLLTEADLYRDEHRRIFCQIRSLLEAGKPADVVTVAEALQDSGDSDSTGGLAYLGELVNNTPSAANIKRYAEIVRERSVLRQLLATAGEIAADALNPLGRDAETLLDEAESKIFRISERHVPDGNEEAEAVGSILASVVEDIQERFDRGGQISGLPTGFTDLDEKTCGFQGGDLIIVAGRPSMGKTAFALNIAENVAVDSGLPVCIFSMEMEKKQLAERSLASLGGIPMNAIRSGQGIEWDTLSFALGKLHRAPLHIDDTPALTVMQMRSRARRMARKYGLSLIVVDYIQLARGDSASTKNGNREQEVSSISRGLKALAKEFNCPVIALSQLNRKVDDRADKRPMMSDLRDSGAIEQDADVILMMYRDEYYNKESPDNKGMAEVIIGKQRNGPTGTVRLAFLGEHSRFRNLSQEAKAHFAEVQQAARQSAPIRQKLGFD